MQTILRFVVNQSMEHSLNIYLSFEVYLEQAMFFATMQYPKSKIGFKEPYSFACSYKNRVLILAEFDNKSL